MKRWIVLLRGVTPTGKNRVPMADFREALGRAGFQNARTWIQSGNALVDTPLNREETIKAVSRVLAEDIGADLTVIVKTADELRWVLDGNPFTDGLPERVFYGQFQQQPDKAKVKALLVNDFGEEKLVITDWAVYCYIPGSAAGAKLTNAFLERKLGVRLTTRNANTLNKLVALAKEI